MEYKYILSQMKDMYLKVGLNEQADSLEYAMAWIPNDSLESKLDTYKIIHNKFYKMCSSNDCDNCKIKKLRNEYLSGSGDCEAIYALLVDDKFHSYYEKDGND